MAFVFLGFRVLGPSVQSLDHFWVTSWINQAHFRVKDSRQMYHTDEGRHQSLSLQIFWLNFYARFRCEICKWMLQCGTESWFAAMFLMQEDAGELSGARDWDCGWKKQSNGRKRHIRIGRASWGGSHQLVSRTHGLGNEGHSREHKSGGSCLGGSRCTGPL